MKTSTIKSVYFFLGVISLIVIWWLADIIVNNTGIVPSIKEVVEALINIFKNSNTYSMIFFTLYKIVIAVLISLLISVVLATLSLINYRMESFIRPLITFIRTVPVVSVAMLVLIIFFDQSIRYQGTVVITTFVIIPIIYEAILTGFKTINASIIDNTKLLSNFNLKVLFNVHIPLALPYILTSLFQSFGLGLKVLVMSEVIVNPNNSIGKEIGEYASYGMIDYVFAWTLILVIIVLVVDLLLKKIKIRSWE